MQDNVDEEPGSTSSQQGRAKRGLNQSLSLIADGINILAAKANKPEAEKSWDKAERDRKKQHDDRTYKRQGWAIIIASVAVTFNCIALIGLGFQSWNASNAVRISQQTLEMNSRPSIALSHQIISRKNLSVELSFSAENKSTSAVYIYASPINFSDIDEEISYKNIIENPRKSPPIAQIFPMDQSTTMEAMPAIPPLINGGKDNKLYVTFSVLASSFGKSRYIISQCLIFTGDGSKLTTDGKFCKHNQRYESLEDYLSEKSDAF